MFTPKKHHHQTPNPLSLALLRQQHGEEIGELQGQEIVLPQNHRISEKEIDQRPERLLDRGLSPLSPNGVREIRYLRRHTHLSLYSPHDQ